MLSVEALLGRIIHQILEPLALLLFGAALILFLWGGFQFVSNADSPDGRTQGRETLIWGIVGMVIMVSAYAILQIATLTFGIELPR